VDARGAAVPPVWFYSRIPRADVRHFGRRPAAAEVDVHENGRHPVPGRRGL
jgi:hypothetical protein